MSENTVNKKDVVKKKSHAPLVLMIIAILTFCIGSFLLTAFIFTFFMPSTVRKSTALGVAAGIVLLLFIIFLVSYIVSVKKNPDNRPGRKARVIFIGLAAFYSVAIIGSTVGSNIRSINLNKAIKPVFPPKKGDDSLPDDPCFVFYNESTHWLEYPDKNRFPKAASSPDEVNVYVFYEVKTYKTGKWVEKNSGKTQKYEYGQSITIELRRADNNETIIDSKKFSYANKGNSDPLRWSEVVEYINTCLEK